MHFLPMVAMVVSLLQTKLCLPCLHFPPKGFSFTSGLALLVRDHTSFSSLAAHLMYQILQNHHRHHHYKVYRYLFIAISLEQSACLSSSDPFFLYSR
ncbi:hypothetical protein F4778DRAFT_639145 [Xylariomycetidae sp. FL2044]|nr:hypothetical protein F4778DRAFT_639145 [Xylariomycetidae sp. FL2044]